MPSRGVPDAVVEEVRRAADILDVASEFAEFRRVGREHVARCPYPDHEDKTPSFFANPEKNVYLCRGCKKKGDAIQLVRDLDGLSFADTVRSLAGRYGVDAGSGGGPALLHGRARRKARPEPPPPPPVEPARDDLGGLATRFTAALPGSLGEKYLASRGVPPDLARRHGLGYAAPGEWPQDRREGGGRNRAHLWRYGRIVVPHQRLDGTLVSLYGRAVGEAAKLPQGEVEAFKRRKHRHLPGNKGFFNARVLGDGRGALHVAEGPFDALALLASGCERTVAIFAAREWKWHWIPPDVRRLVLAFDTDETGREAREQLSEGARLRGIEVAYLDTEAYGGEKDPAAAYASGKLSIGEWPDREPDHPDVGEEERQRRRTQTAERERCRAEAEQLLARAREEAELNRAVGPAPKPVPASAPRTGPGDELTVERAVAELRRGGSGPALALANHLESRSERSIEHVIRAVVHARGLDPSSWREHAGTVEEAVKVLGRERVKTETLERTYAASEKRSREALDRAVVAEPADIPDDPRERLRRNVAGREGKG